MAISFIGSTGINQGANTAQSINVGFFANNGSSTTAAAYQADDVVILGVVQGHSGNSAATIAVPTAGAQTTSYASLGTAAFGNDSDDVTVQLFAAKLTGSPSSGTFGTQPANGNASNGQVIMGVVLRGVDYDALINLNNGASKVNANGQNTAVADCPSVTPTVAGSWIVGFGGGGLNATLAGYTAPANASTGNTSYNRSALSNTPTQKCVGGQCLKVDWSSGAFDFNAFGGGTVSTRSGWAASTLVVPPLAAVTPEYLYKGAGNRAGHYKGAAANDSARYLGAKAGIYAS